MPIEGAPPAAHALGEMARRQPHDFERFFEMSLDMLCIADTQGYFRRINRAFERVLGWSRAELLRRPFLEFVHPEDVEPTLQEIGRLAAGVSTTSFENRYRCSDGTYRHLLWSAFPEAETNLLYCVARDMTEEYQRDAFTRQLANAVQQTADTVIITDKTGTIVYVNPAFEQTTGYTAAEVEGQTPRILKSNVHPPEFYRRLWADLLAGRVFRGIVTNRKKNQELYQAEQTITPVTDREGKITHFVSVVKDITERLKREEQEVELRLAASIQKRLYPRETPKVAGLDLAATTAAADALSGDYFDFVTLRDGALGIAVGDVCGHGLGQALLMVETRAFLRSLALEHTNVGTILTALDRLLAPDLALASFVSLVLVRLDPATRSFQYASAGHEPGYLLDRFGRVKAELTSTGLPLGLPADFAPGRTVQTSPTMAFERGDVLVLLTDGLVEAESRDGETFGRQRVAEAVGARVETTAQAMLDGLSDVFGRFLDGMPQADDITTVVCKCQLC
jgi:PAS domain S-box-containing protein